LRFDWHPSQKQAKIW